MINHLQHTIILEQFPQVAEVKDPHDGFLVDMAIAGKADYLVTGDHRAGILQP